jgi:hypothetical protein
MTNTNCCVYSVEIPDGGQWICPKDVKFCTKINLGNSASHWLLLQEYITMHGPLNVKFVTKYFQFLSVLRTLFLHNVIFYVHRAF